MTNEVKAKEIADAITVMLEDYENCYAAAIAMAVIKDAQKISELGGWHTEPPTEDGCYLAEAKYIPYKNSCFLVAEYDTNAQCWYDEAYENPIEIERWKRI